MQAEQAVEGRAGLLCWYK